MTEILAHSNTYEKVLFRGTGWNRMYPHYFAECIKCICPGLIPQSNKFNQKIIAMHPEMRTQFTRIKVYCTVYLLDSPRHRKKGFRQGFRSRESTRTFNSLFYRIWIRMSSEWVGTHPSNLLAGAYNQCFESVFIDQDPGFFWWPKIEKNFNWKKLYIFLIKNCNLSIPWPP